MSNGFVPTVEILEKDENPNTGHFHYKVKISDPSINDHQYDVNIDTGTQMDFTDKATLQELWRKYGFKHSQDYGD